jgi:hypothetical protein
MVALGTEGVSVRGNLGLFGACRVFTLDILAALCGTIGGSFVTALQQPTPKANDADNQSSGLTTGPGQPKALKAEHKKAIGTAFFWSGPLTGSLLLSTSGSPCSPQTIPQSLRRSRSRRTASKSTSCRRVSASVLSVVASETGIGEAFGKKPLAEFRHPIGDSLVRFASTWVTPHSTR